MAVVLTAALMLPPAPYVLADIEPPCQPGYVHYSVLCLSPAEFEAMWNPPPAPISDVLTGEDLARRLIAAYFPSWAVESAVRVVGCETGYTYDPWSKNQSSGASGLFQHMPRYWSARSSAAGWVGASIFDPDANVAVAAWLWGQTGTWQHWSCKP